MQKGGGVVLPENEYGLSEATKGLTKLDLREQELKDMEVARKLQEEELKVRERVKCAPIFFSHCTFLFSPTACTLFP